MKKALFLAFTAAVLLAGCKDEKKPNNPGPSVGRCVMTEFAEGSDVFFSVKYDAARRPIELNSDGDVSTITYNAEGKIDRITSDGIFDRYSYPAADQVVVETFVTFQDTPVLNWKTVYFLSNGYVQKEEGFAHDSTGSNPRLEYQTVYERDLIGNITKASSFDANGTPQGSTLYEGYDMKHSPFANLPLSEEWPWLDSPSNPAKMKFVDTDGTVIDEQTFSYTYNSNNYPSTLTVGVDAETLTFQLKYNCL